MVEPNTFICNNSLEFLKKLDDKCIDLCLTDPPYGIGLQVGNNAIRGKNKYNCFDDTPEYIENTIIPIIKECLRISKVTILTPGSKNILKYPQFSAMGMFYMPAAVGFNSWGISDSQPILYYGNSPHGNTHRISFTLTEKPSADFHPCSKPINAWKKLLSLGSKEGDLVIDPFCGSGTTAIACHDMKRNFLCIDIDESYINQAKQRYINHSAQLDLFNVNNEDSNIDNYEKQTMF
jgi:DNA modification methylase